MSFQIRRSKINSRNGNEYSERAYDGFQQKKNSLVEKRNRNDRLIMTQQIKNWGAKEHHIWWFSANTYFILFPDTDNYYK